MHRRRWSKSLHARDPGAVAGWNDTPLRPLFSYIFLGASVCKQNMMFSTEGNNIWTRSRHSSMVRLDVLSHLLQSHVQYHWPYLIGMHVILFVTCMRILLRRPRRRKAHISMLLVAVVMFVLSAADVALSWNIGINHADVLFLGNTSQLYLKIYPKIILFYINRYVILYILLIWLNVHPISSIIADILLVSPMFYLPGHTCVRKVTFPLILRLFAVMSSGDDVSLFCTSVVRFSSES